MDRKQQLSEKELLSDFTQTLQARLPQSWRTEARTSSTNGSEADLVVDLLSPSGDRAKLLVEAKSKLDPRDLPRLREQVQRFAQELDATSIVVVAPFLGLRTRELLTELGWGYGDATGNFRVVMDKPALFIQSSGAESNPWREDQPLQSLRGRSAGRAVRGFCDFRPPFGIEELAQRSQTSISSISRVAALLDREALVTRDRRGAVLTTDWPGILQRWVQDYSLQRSNRARSFLEPRNLDQLLEKLKGQSWRYAVSASLAATRVAPIAGPRLAVIYTDELLSKAAGDLGLTETDLGGNVMLLEPYDGVVFDRTWSRDGVTYAALTQVSADLLTSPGRGPAEGEELVRWMQGNEDAWRA